MVWTVARVHLTESLNTIWNAILIRLMQENKLKIINEVDLLKENQDIYFDASEMNEHNYVFENNLPILVSELY